MKKKRFSGPKRGEIIARIVFPEEQWIEEEIDQLAEPGFELTKSEKNKFGGEGTKAIPMILDDNRNIYKLIQAARNGLTYESLRYAQEIMPFSIKEWARILHVSVRTLDRLKKDGSKLNLSLSDKLIQIALLFDYGTDVFGTLEKFSKWLGRTNIALGGIEPKSLLDTNQGINAIRTSLSRIEHGIPV